MQGRGELAPRGGGGLSSNEFTGERVVPGKVDVNLWNEHFARYVFAARFCKGKRVLDLGCGTGYGAAELARHAASVAGVDIAEEAVSFAASHYPGVDFRQASCTATPFPDASFDVITAFEVIEHLTHWRMLLAEARRLLKRNGLFLVSTPNRLYYAESRGQSGANPFHTHEFEYEEFREELAAYFPSVEILLQNRLEAMGFYPPSQQRAAQPEAWMEMASDPASSHFFLAVCGSSIHTSDAFLYIPAAANILRERETHIAKLQAELALKEQWLAQSKSERTSLRKLYDQMQQDLEQRNHWARTLESELTESRARVVQLQRELEKEQKAGQQLASAYEAKIADLEKDIREKTAWAHETEKRLGGELQAKLKELAEAVKLLDKAEATVEERSTWALELQAKIDLIRESRWVKLGRMVGVGPVA